MARIEPSHLPRFEQCPLPCALQSPPFLLREALPYHHRLVDPPESLGRLELVVDADDAFHRVESQRDCFGVLGHACVDQVHGLARAAEGPRVALQTHEQCRCSAAAQAERDDWLHSLTQEFLAPQVVAATEQQRRVSERRVEEQHCSQCTRAFALCHRVDETLSETGSERTPSK